MSGNYTLSGNGERLSRVGGSQGSSVATVMGTLSYFPSPHNEEKKGTSKKETNQIGNFYSKLELLGK